MPAGQLPSPVMSSEPVSTQQMRQQMTDQKNRLLTIIETSVREEAEILDRRHQAVDDLRILKLATWDEIGAALGISGQAAYQRYGKQIPGKPSRRS